MRICSRLFSALVHFHNPQLWPSELKAAVAAGCRVTPSFITEEEEAELLREVEPHMKRLRYEKSHWDDAIHLYREREQRKWSPANEKVIQRVRHAHHEDHPMKLTSENEASFPRGSEHLSYVHILDLHKDGVIKPHIDSVRLNVVFREVGRYEFTHETLSNEESYFNGKKIEKTRRISIICRDLPHPEHRAEGPAIQMRTLPEAG
ncbi:hypothetical protein OESDEN_04084 [Oesophagostomum dentatum]|uniref:Alpha-ketoglutarate-dependent dioxygenase AlkB-like domain-containing protein n=1 Tax=Oesophagostomum dentatum TaxID=61180 RepID=A0A0B1TIL4_OESDE|nr:hypothetical protein OESDEN_04084 [Oesophagostomum dentatum]